MSNYNGKQLVVQANQHGLGYALTNPTHTTKAGGKRKKFDEFWNRHMQDGIVYKDVQYADVERAYQTHKDVNEIATKPDMFQSGNMKLMIKLIVIKFRTYPELVEQVKLNGGLEMLAYIIHQPSKANSVWEDKGGGWFRIALYNAFRIVTTKIVQL